MLAVGRRPLCDTLDEWRVRQCRCTKLVVQSGCTDNHCQCDEDGRSWAPCGPCLAGRRRDIDAEQSALDLQARRCGFRRVQYTACQVALHFLELIAIHNWSKYPRSTTPGTPRSSGRQTIATAASATAANSRVISISGRPRAARHRGGSVPARREVHRSPCLTRRLRSQNRTAMKPSTKSAPGPNHRM